MRYSKVDALALIRNLIFQVNGALPEKVAPDASLIKDLLMDSVELIDLLMRLEEHEIFLKESDITSALTVSKLADIVAGSH